MLDLLDRLAREASPPTARIPYGEAPQQFGDLRLPASATPEPYPVVIVIHGGYWRNRYDLAYFGAACGALADMGLASWNIEYRRIGDAGGAGGAWPDTFADVAVAADALREVAARYPLDLSRVLTLGHSAGGQLTLWLAARPRIATDSPLWRADPQPIAGAVALAGVVDLRRAWKLGLSENATEALMGATPAAAPERYASVSPYDLAPLGLPQILFHGTADGTVPFELSERYVNQAHSLGDDARLVAQAGAGHFEAVDPATPEWRAVGAELARLARR